MTTAPAKLFAKGSTVHGTLEYLGAMHGPGTLARVLGALPPLLRARLETVAPTGELDYDDLVMLWSVADAALSPTVPDWSEQAGAFSIAHRGSDMYGGLLRKATPDEFLQQSVSLFQLFYHPGDIALVEHGAKSAVVRLVGFDARTPAFCRRQVGGLAKAIDLAGGAASEVRHVRCALEGDAFCEWSLAWK
ncbi:MAG: hypothetical protein HYX65_08195 [Gemmatimonadetes bacterium]|nr:hypothetical protein [Gemmatimonadota bacterium]